MKVKNFQAKTVMQSVSQSKSVVKSLFLIKSYDAWDHVRGGAEGEGGEDPWNLSTATTK